MPQNLKEYYYEWRTGGRLAGTGYATSHPEAVAEIAKAVPVGRRVVGIIYAPVSFVQRETEEQKVLVTPSRPLAIPADDAEGGEEVGS